MQYMSKALSATLIAVTLSLTGCASIVSDSAKPVRLVSAPEGATFEIRNEDGEVVHKGTAPSTVTLKAGSGYFDGETYSIKFQKDGFEDQTVTLNSGINGWYFGNIMLGGLVGMLIVDPLTGAMYSLPESATATMIQSTASMGKAGPKELTIMNIEQLTPAQRNQLVPLKG